MKSYWLALAVPLMMACTSKSTSIHTMGRSPATVTTGPAIDTFPRVNVYVHRGPQGWYLYAESARICAATARRVQQRELVTHVEASGGRWLGVLALTGCALGFYSLTTRGTDTGQGVNMALGSACLAAGTAVAIVPVLVERDVRRPIESVEEVTPAAPQPCEHRPIALAELEVRTPGAVNTASTDAAGCAMIAGLPAAGDATAILVGGRVADSIVYDEARWKLRCGLENPF